MRLSLDLMTKQKFKKENPLSFDNPYVICGFHLGTTKIYGPNSNKMSYYDFIAKKEHHFLRNTFTEEALQTSKNISSLNTFYEFFDRFIYISTCLATKKYSTETNLQEIEDDLIMTNIINECSFDTYDELLTEILQHKHNCF